MQITVLLQRVEGNGYRARAGEPLPLTAEGATREEALAKLHEQVRTSLPAGAELVALDVAAPAAPHPLARFAGMFKDDADFAEVLQIMAENRRQMDADPDVP